MPRSRRNKSKRAAGLLAGAAAFAAAELAAGILLGGFFGWGRAEALLFFAFRPWLLLAAALLAARLPRRERAGFYALALGLAGLAESLFLLALGGDPWAEMLRGLAAGAALALLVDLLLQLGRRLRGRAGQAAATALIVLLLALPGPLRLYEALALGPTSPEPAAEQPAMLLMTGLPIVWGESGAFDPAGRAAAVYRALEAEFEVRPVDHFDGQVPGSARLMLIAQPRPLAPTELVALDDWVRRGGRILILADPHLVWPSRLPLGDIRRPPTANALTPLLAHWGVRIDPASETVRIHDFRHEGSPRRLVTAAEGRVSGGPCRPLHDLAVAARCRIGAGEAVVVADADLLLDALWTSPGEGGEERHRRTSDNPLIVADLLDGLAGVERERSARAVQWLRPGADRGRALRWAAAPILAILLAAAWSARPQRNSRTYPQRRSRE